MEHNQLISSSNGDSEVIDATTQKPDGMPGTKKPAVSGLFIYIDL
ncbi:MAG: hypothetical protein ACLRSX_03480 [Akkermansia sp.]|jgi:hypothetical protein|nr:MULTISPECIES: hypothetical protein [Akkermansia]